MFPEIEGCLIHGFPCGISLNYDVSELFSLSKKDEENVKIVTERRRPLENLCQVAPFVLKALLDAEESCNR